MVIGPVIPVSAVDELLAKVAADLGKLSQQVRDLELERSMLLRLKQSAVSPGVVEHHNGNGGNPTSEEDGSEVRLPTAQAIYYVIRHNPGLVPAEVVNRAEPIIDTVSADKRRLLYSAISNMKRKMRFRVDSHGGLHLKTTGQEQMPLTG